MNSKYKIGDKLVLDLPYEEFKDYKTIGCLTIVSFTEGENSYYSVKIPGQEEPLVYVNKSKLERIPYRIATDKEVILYFN